MYPLIKNKFFLISFSDLVKPVENAAEKFRAAPLTCGEPIPFTAVDHLDGIESRFYYPVYPEPEVALLFRKNEFDTVQMDVIERNLLEAMKGVILLLPLPCRNIMPLNTCLFIYIIYALAHFL